MKTSGASQAIKLFQLTPSADEKDSLRGDGKELIPNERQLSLGCSLYMVASWTLSGLRNVLLPLSISTLDWKPDGPQ